MTAKKYGNYFRFSTWPDSTRTTKIVPDLSLVHSILHWLVAAPFRKVRDVLRDVLDLEYYFTHAAEVMSSKQYYLPTANYVAMNKSIWKVVAWQGSFRYVNF